MSGWEIDCTLDLSVLQEMRGDAQLSADEVVREIAFKVEAKTKLYAPLDTGALRNSVYTVTKEMDGYQLAASGVAKVNPDTSTEAHPAVEAHVVRVGPCVEYAEYVEFPGHVRRGGQRPYFYPAWEEVIAEYRDAAKWNKIVS